MSLHQSLKTSTNEIHNILEKDLNLLRNDLTLDDYVHLLKRFYGIYLPLEKKLSLDAENSKTPSLKEDLEFFKCDVHKIEICSTIPEIPNRAYAYGVRYVLEGSNLGALVLTKHFKEKFNLLPGHGLSFFSGHQEKTLQHWKSFLLELETLSISEGWLDKDSIDGAHATFHLLHSWLLL